MELETILNAMNYAQAVVNKASMVGSYELNDPFVQKRERQWVAFRARILRMVAEKDAEIEKWKEFARNKEERSRK